MIRTIEDNFDYQAHEIFNKFIEDYKFYADQQKEMKLSIKPFSIWLYENELKELGKLFYDKFDEYAGIEEETEKYNIQ